MTSTPIRIGIIDPHEIVRQSLQVFLETTTDLIFVGEASSEAESLSLCERDKPDVVLIDFLQDDGLGIGIITTLHRMFPAISMIVLTTVITPERIVQALLAGAVGYFYKQIDIDTLANAIRSAYSGQQIFDEEVNQILQNANYAKL